MKHKKSLVTAAAIALVGMTSPAFAAELSNANGQTCDGVGVWHFVNNQTGGASAGLLDVTFSDGTVWSVAPYKVLRNTQHFQVESSDLGTLISASTNLPGRLVLSDFECEEEKK